MFYRQIDISRLPLAIIHGYSWNFHAFTLHDHRYTRLDTTVKGRKDEEGRTEKERKETDDHLTMPK